MAEDISQHEHASVNLTYQIGNPPQNQAVSDSMVIWRVEAKLAVLFYPSALEWFLLWISTRSPCGQRSPAGAFTDVRNKRVSGRW